MDKETRLKEIGMRLTALKLVLNTHYGQLFGVQESDEVIKRKNEMSREYYALLREKRDLLNGE